MSKKEPSYPYYIEQFEKAKKEAEELILPLNDRIFRRQPSSKSWCIGECFSHLVETGNRYYKNAEKGVDEAAKPGVGARNPMHIRFFMKWFVKYLEPPIKVKTKAPGPFKPTAYAGLDKDEILNDYLALQDKYISLLEIAETNKLNLSVIKVPNPIIPLVKMTAAECVTVTEAHQRRHLVQARNVKKIVEET